MLVQLFLLNIKVSFLHEAFYHYEGQNDGSITRIYTRDSFYEQQMYVEELRKLLPEKYEKTIEVAAFQIKTGAFYHGVLSEEEFYHYMPTSLRTILFCKCANKWRLRMLLSYMGLYCWIKRIWINYKKSR